MIDPYDMNEAAFKVALATKTTPAELLANAVRIYDYLGEVFGSECEDSVLREWSFQWWAAETGRDYDVIFHSWLNCVVTV